MHLTTKNSKNAEIWWGWAFLFVIFVIFVVKCIRHQASPARQQIPSITTT